MALLTPHCSSPGPPGAATEAKDLLADDWSVDTDLWSVTSYKALREDALSAERWNRLHPSAPRRTPFVTECLSGGTGPVVAVTEYMRSVPDQVARWVSRPYTSLGTDGFGRSDTREVLRRFFEIDAAHLVIAALSGLERDGWLPGGPPTRLWPVTGWTPDLPTRGLPERQVAPLGRRRPYAPTLLAWLTASV